MTDYTTEQNTSTAKVIDFVAYHDLQAQCGLSAYEELSKIIPCKWRIGPNSEPSPNAIGAVMLDHSGFQRNVHKGTGGYPHLFHMSHDLGDISIYVEEFAQLSNYDIIFTPTTLHTAVVRKFYEGRSRIGLLEVGWAKYDLMSAEDARNQFAKTLNLPCAKTILYAPTYAKNYEWRDLFPALLNYPDVNVIVKNHIYVNPGQPFPPGHEEVYKRELQSADEMEAAVTELKSPRLVVAPRTLNICSLFPKVDLLISDCSSVLTEFLPFGNSVETGRCGLGLNDNKPEMSKFYAAIKYIPTSALRIMLEQKGLHELLQPVPFGQNDVYGLKRDHVGRSVAQAIAAKLELNSNAA